MYEPYSTVSDSYLQLILQVNIRERLPGGEACTNVQKRNGKRWEIQATFQTFGMTSIAEMWL